MKEQLKKLALDVRNAIEKMDISEFPDSCSFERFPRGCCGDSSDLLSKHYMLNGIMAEYVCGINEKGQSHAWLEHKGFIIDITADQFEEIKDKVLVTDERGWHKQFKEIERQIHDYESFNRRNKERLSKIFANISKKIDDNK